jgi:hypothetical protein
MKWAIATIVLGALAGCRTGKSIDLDVYGTVQSFRWTEKVDGAELVEETGVLFGAGATWNPPPARVRYEIFGGQVNYDGHTQPPELTPVETDVNYFGGLFEGDYRFIWRRDKPFNISPLAGGGSTWWIRDLESSTDSLGNPVSGATEYWFSFYAHVGVDFEQKLGSDWRLFGLARAGYSLYNLNDASSAGFDATLEPEPGPRFRGEIGVARKRVCVALFGEHVVFHESDVSGGALQPESEMTIFGVRVGWTF